MARKKSKKDETGVRRLTIRLFGPGMSRMHRAGLGGLASTLKKIEREVKLGQLEEDQIPGWPWEDGKPPWRIGPTELVLDFGTPEGARPFLKALFQFAFQIRDDLIFLPGQYGDTPPSMEVRAYLQQGMTLTFLQHGKARKLGKKEVTYSYQPEGDTGPTIQVSYKPCSWYKHQDGWKELVEADGCLTTKPVEVAGPVNPGSVVRHVAYTGQTKIKEGVEHVLSLYFALVGCLALPINRGSGVLIVPDVTDLEAFSTARAWMTPPSARDCRIAGASDAALQAQVRLRSKMTARTLELPGCDAITFQKTDWDKKQKSRVRALFVPSGSDRVLDVFEKALAELPPRVISRTVQETSGRGRKRTVVERTEWFWVDSVVRPLVAENLARGDPWYSRFVDLMTKIDPATKKPIRDRILFEKRGLHAMIEEPVWKDRGESTVVRAVHQALRQRYGQIADENSGNPVAMKNRMDSEYDRWRLAFAGAKTPDQFRKSLCDLLSRAGVNPVLQAEWEQLLPMLDASRWQQTRDLALLALASYSRKESDEEEGALNDEDASEAVA